MADPRKFFWGIMVISLVIIIGQGCAGGRTNHIRCSNNVILSWNQNNEPDLAGYKVYIGLSSRNYGSPIDVGNHTTYIAKGFCTGTFYFTVTAYDHSRNQSGFSNEVSETFAETIPHEEISD